jgi:L-threonylcarbamoyladenylate synthase
MLPDMHVQEFSASHSKSSVVAAANALRSGGLVVYPTDTVYGLACDATNQSAVNKLRAFKGQRGNKAVSIAVRNQAMAEQFAELNRVAQNLYQQFLPGPLTIISNVARRSSLKLATGICSLENTVGIRIIPHPFVAELFKHINFPITATSANISGGANPRSRKQWLESTPQKKQDMIDLFVDAGELPYSEPSTIIDTSKEDTEIIRQGTLELAHLVDRRSSSIQSFDSHSPQETKKIAHEIYENTLSSSVVRRSSPVIIALQGPLGAGKTVFTQGLAHALGISEPLRSPTYTLVKEYKLSKQKLDNADTLSKSALSSRADLATARSQTVEGPRSSHVDRRTFYHIDAWRLSSPDEFQDLGLNEMLETGNIIVIEWPQRLSDLMQTLTTKASFSIVTIEVVANKKRKIAIESLS